MPHQLLGQLPEDQDSPISQGFGLPNWPAEAVLEVYNTRHWTSLREVADDEQFQVMKLFLVRTLVSAFSDLGGNIEALTAKMTMC